ncbi:MAG: Rpn family recombination-promoting nuclease/putative transposase [Desulfamplus sp.]
MTQNQDNNQHDTGYKLLFSHPELVKDLLTGFVKEDWVWVVDLNTLESVNTSFVTDDLRERHDDKIWRVRFRGQWLYLYLLLEFQSSDDYFMAVRIMTYIGLLYQDIIRSHGLKKGDILPPVVPIVIYNGKSAWKSPCEIRELINPVHQSLEKFTPHISYWLLDEGRVGADNLEEFKGNKFNLTAEVIAFELCKSVEEIRKHISRLHEHLKEPENQQLRRTFAMWLSRLLRSRLKNDNIPEFQELKEVDSMLAETITEWTEQWMAEGEAKGEVKGEAKGIGKGELIGRLRLLQQILNKPISSKEELIAMEMNELKTLCESIEKEWQVVQN